MANFLLLLLLLLPLLLPLLSFLLLLSSSQIVASDRGTPPRKKDHILQVTILDVNDNPPVIESPFGYNVSVNEVNSPDGQQLTTQSGPWTEADHEKTIQMSSWPHRSPQSSESRS